MMERARGMLWVCWRLCGRSVVIREADAPSWCFPAGVLQRQPTNQEAKVPSAPRPCSAVRKGLCTSPVPRALGDGVASGAAWEELPTGQGKGYPPRAASVSKAFLLQRSLARGEKVCDVWSV